MYMRDDLENIGYTLKQLDALDTKQYAQKTNRSEKILKKMAASPDSGQAQDSNASDFDNSEDLASLLGDDDDDDEYAKKVFGNPTSKTLSSDEKKTNPPEKVSSANQFLQSPSKKILKPATDLKETYDELGDDVLDEFLQSNVVKTASSHIKLSSPEKSKSVKNSLQNENDDYLDELSLSQFSPSKDKNKKSISKTSDIADNLSRKSISSKSPEKRRGSYFDDFLQKLPTENENKVPAVPDVCDEKLMNNDESDQDILGTYISNAEKKKDSTTQDVPKSPKKRASLSKQVSFKGFSDDFPESDIYKPKTFNSTDKSRTKDIIPESKKTENSTLIKRSEKAKLNKDEDLSWLSSFSPKKVAKPQETKRKTNDSQQKIDSFSENKSKPLMKRQSSADWLGLSDSKLLDENNENGSIKNNRIDKTISQSTKSKTVSAPIIKPQSQETNKITSEFQGNDFITNIDQSSTIDLSEILNDDDVRLPNKESKSSFLNDVSENETFGSISRNRKNTPLNTNTQIISSDTSLDNFISNVITHKSHILNKHSDESSRNLHENFAALQSMELRLDDSIKERDKLLKDKEATKTILEEKIKTSEEFYKSKIKTLEDSFKTQETSLKQECGIKFKSLEERLDFITEEKEKQAKNFEEKVQNLLKEHQLEIQRLKELHNHSISIMKQDHEDSLNRLKKLKEQEIEAILSTQVHSKSLQYLSDQLEARANELASLENKIEERSQSTLREKQLFLDTKEKELKALQCRLQKQLDDSEEEKTRLQQLVLRLESRLQKLTIEGEEDHWETQQLKSKLTVHQKYLEEEQKLNQYQLEKEKEKLKMAQDSLLHEQKTVLLQLAQERQQFTQEKNDLQALAKTIKEEETKLNIRKLKEESLIEAEKQFLTEDKNKLHFEKEKVKQEFYQLERERDTLMKEKQQLKRDRETLHEQEMDLKRKSAEIEEIAATANLAQNKAKREHAEALAIKKEQQHRMEQHSQQMQVLMDKERDILCEREKLMAEKIEFEKNKNSVLCTKCKLSLETPLQVSTTPSFNIPVVWPLPGGNGLSSQIHQSFMDPNLVIWHVAAQKDREFLQEELAFLKSLKEASKRKNSK